MTTFPFTEAPKETSETMMELHKMIRKFESLSSSKATPQTSKVKGIQENSPYIEQLRLNNAIRSANF